MRIRYLAVVYITIILFIASVVAEEVKIMGLTEKNSALLDGNKSLEYLTGSCQKKKSRMKCHLNHIEVKKIDTTLGCLKVPSSAQFSCPGFGPRSHPTTQYFGQLIGFSA